MVVGTLEPRVEPLKITRVVGTFIVALLRLVVPSLVLSSIYILSFYLLQEPAGISLATENALANPAWWMTMGHLSLMLAFFAVMMTNRAHGPGMALGQVVLSWLTLGGLMYFAISLYGLGTIREELFPTNVMRAFLLGLFAAHVAAIYAFDWKRSIPWWKAPLVAGIVGPLVFVLIFYPLSHPGMDAPWVSWMWMDFVAKAALGVAFLVPYNMMRRMVKPDCGLGGA